MKINNFRQYILAIKDQIKKEKKITKNDIAGGKKRGLDVTSEAIEGIGGFPIGNLIEGFIILIVGINVMSVVADEVNDVANVTGTASQVMGLVPLFFAIAVMFAGINVAIGGLRRSGLV